MKVSKLSPSVRQLIANYFKAVQHNDLDAVQKIISEIRESESNAYSDVVNSLNLEKSGETAIHICAKNGYLEMIKYFVEKEGMKLELIDLDGKTALHDAAQFSKLEIVKYLLTRGANVNVVKKADWTPLMLACTKSDNLEVVQVLVNAGVDLSFVNKDGWTCVHIAAREGNVEVLKLLLQSVDETQRKRLIQTKSRNGRKPIHTAVMHGNLEAAKFLTEGASKDEMNSEDNCGSTPLMDACRCGFQDVAQFLIDEKHVDPAKLNKNGVGLLHVAAEANQAAMIEFLLERYSLDVNQPSELLGFTPLHWASREGNRQTVEVLLKSGANPNIKDARGRTAQEIASDFQKDDLCILYAEYEHKQNKNVKNPG